MSFYICFREGILDAFEDIQPVELFGQLFVSLVSFTYLLFFDTRFLLFLNSYVIISTCPDVILFK